MAGFGKFMSFIDSRSFLYTRSCTLKLSQYLATNATTDSNQVTLPLKPKKPLSSFLLYVRHIRPALIKSNPNIKVTEVVKEASKKWAEMEPTYKLNFSKQYDTNYKIYLEELKRYVDSITEEQKSLMFEQKSKRKDRSATLEIKRKIEIYKKPKKPRNAFLIYMDKNKKERGSDINVKDWISELSKKWKNMSHAEKEQYRVEGTKLMEQYKKDLVAWEKEMISLGHPDIVRHANRTKHTSSKGEQKS
ncbi:mitochondrial transcription factor A [Nomia melanderi]|uniref:mitochondrial transcription factor A n=1 Tax=Nomia melanderi TaxID=2448451 RepID=UPI003FCD70C1